MDYVSTVVGVLAGLLNIALATTLASRQAQLLDRRWFAWLKERPALFRSLLATVGGIVLLLLAYFFLFDTTGTTGYLDVAAMLNANQGVLTLVGLIIAGMTVVISVVGRESVAIQRRQIQQAKVHKRLRLALDETFHNLVHVAQILGPDGARRVQQVPQVSFLSLESLMGSANVEHLSDAVLDTGATILRFRDYMQGVPVKNSFTSDLDRRRQQRQVGRPTADGTLVRVAPTSGSVHDVKLARTLQTFALHCMRLIHEIDRHHHEAVCDSLSTPLRAKLCAALEANRRQKGRVHFHSSHKKVNGRDLRASNRPLLVWANDAADDVVGVDVTEVGQIVFDMLGSH